MFRAAAKYSFSRPLMRCVRHSRLKKSTKWYSTSPLGKQYQSGDRVLGYTVKQARTIPEFSARVTHLIHDKTGAEHLHVAKDDENNFFFVLFRTTPTDSTGVPHILEHTTLCGSEKFPVRDPFFKMLNRSLTTFSNAFTGPDFTMYPFSSQNAQDYRNLMNVYLDAVFFPRLREMDFRQEGWRLENADLKDPSSPIIFKGVVFNEMKGAFASDNQLFHQALMSNLMPDTTYGHTFGGDPEFIPDLTYQQLIQFHKSFYHPSNSKFFTYGSFPLEGHLEYIESQVLSKFNKINPNTEVPMQPRWTEPREMNIQCQPRPMQADPVKNTTLGVSYLCNDVCNQDECMAHMVLGNLLVGNDNSPFYKALIEYQTPFTGQTGYHSMARNAVFSVGLDQIKKEDIEPVKEKIENTLKDVVNGGPGLEEERLEATLHQMDLSIRTPSSNFGFGLAQYLLIPWNHDANPVEVLSINNQIENFRQNMKRNDSFLRDKVKESFLDNSHKLTLQMTPDEKFEESRGKKELARLNDLVGKLSPQEEEDIYKKGLELAEYQDLQEDASCLPTLKVSDIRQEEKRTPFDYVESGGVRIQRCEQPTNGISYFKAISNTRDLPEDVKPYIPLFCYVLNRIGAEDLSYSQMSEEQSRYTGGFSAAPFVREHHTETSTYEEGIYFNSLCLHKNVPKMLHLWSKVFNSAHLGKTSAEERERLFILTREKAEDETNSLAHYGHKIARTHAASSLTPVDNLNEVYSGFRQMVFMANLVNQGNAEEISRNLCTIADHVLNTNNIRMAITSRPEDMSELMNETEKFVAGLQRTNSGSQNIHSCADDFTPQSVNNIFAAQFPNSFVGACIKTVPRTHEDYLKLVVLSTLLTNKFIHKEVREKGGAYGAGASQRDSLFSFISYRDPNVPNTINKFREAAQWIQQGHFTDLDIDEAKLRIFAEVDLPTTPNDAGFREFGNGISDDLAQELRNRLFNVERKDMFEVAERYLLPDRHPTSITVFGPSNEELTQSEGFRMINS